MSAAVDVPMEVRALAEALGVLGEDGRLNDQFLAHPLDVLGGTLRERRRREALLSAVRGLLPADAPADGEAGVRRTVHPLLPGMTGGRVALTLEVREEPSHLDVVVGLLGDCVATDGTALAVELPLVHARDDVLMAIAGTAEGPLSVTLDKPLEDGVAAAVRARVSAAGGRLAIRLSGVDLGAGSLPDLEVDTDDLGDDALQVVVALLRGVLATVDTGEDPALEAIVDHLPGLLGIDPVVPLVPVLEVLQRPGALREWLASLAPASGDVSALRAWATHLAGLLGITVTLPDVRPTAGAPWTVPLFPGPPALALTLALGFSADGSAPTLLAGVRLAADGPGSVRAELVLDATLVEVPLAGAGPARVLPRAAIGVRGPRLTDVGPLLGPPSEVQVGALRAGMRWDGAALAPELELFDVVLPGLSRPLDRVDLSDADTLAASARELLGDALDALLGTRGLAAPLRTLLGLDSSLGFGVDLAELAAAPTRAVARYHREALGRPEGWKPQLRALARLLGVEDPTSAPGGSGTAADPWALDVPVLSGAGVTVALVAWDASPDGDTRGLRVGLGLRGQAAPDAVVPWALRWDAELLGCDLPPAGPATLSVLGGQRANVRSAPLPELPPLGGVAVGADAVEVALAWIPGAPLRVSARLEGAAVRAAGEDGELQPALVLGDLTFPGALDVSRPDLGLPVPPATAWPALRLVLARAARSLGGEPARLLAGLLGLGGATAPGLPGGWPDLPLPDPADLRTVFDDPAALLRAWLAQLAGAAALDQDGVPYLTHALAAVQTLLADATGALPNVPGRGTADDPWRVALADGPAEVEALAWLAPDGPPVAWAQAAVGRLGQELTGALVEAAAHLPGAAAALVGRTPQELAERLEALTAYLAGTDGVVPLDAAQPGAGAWRLGTTVTAAHHQLPATAEAVAQVAVEIATRTAGLADDEWAVLLLGPAFAPPDVWDELLGPVAAAQRVAVTLDVPGVDPAVVDLGALTAASHYAVRLRDDGAADLTAQVARVAARVRAVKPGAKLVLVAHSTAGAAAVRYAAAHPDEMLGVVTLGSPLAPVTLAPLEDPALADAVRAARRIAGSLAAPALGAALAFWEDVLDGWGAPAGAPPRPVALPAPSFRPDGSLPDLGAIPALAIAGQLDAVPDEAILDVLASALAARPAGGAAATHLVCGIAAALGLPAPGASGVEVQLTARVELGHLALMPGVGAAGPRALQVRAWLVRPGGWLLDAAEEGLGARVRWAEVVLDAAVDAAGTAVTADVRLCDASLRGSRAAVAGLGDALGQQLFALLMEELDGLAATDARLRALLELLTDELGLLVRPAGAGHPRMVAAEAAAALRGDAVAWLRARLPARLARPEGIAGFTVEPGATPARGPWKLALTDLPLELVVSSEPWAIVVHTTGDGLAPAGEVWLSGAARIPLVGGAATVAAELHVAGLALRRDGASGAVTVAVNGVLPATPLVPPAPAGVWRMRILAALPDLLTAGVLAALLEELVAGDAGEARLANLPRFLHDPGGHLRSALYDEADAGRVRALLRALAAPLGLTVRADGTVVLPGGLELSGTTSAAGLAVRLVTPAGGLDVAGAANVLLALGVTVDRAGRATPAADVQLGIDLPGGGAGSWADIVVGAGLDAAGPRLWVKPGGSGRIELVPRFSGWEAVVGAAADRLLPQALDGLAAGLPVSQLKTDALGVAQALGIRGSTFADGPVPLRALSLQTLVDRAGAIAGVLATLLDNAFGSRLPGTLAASPGGKGVVIEVPGVLEGTLRLRAELSPVSVELGMDGAALGPVAADLDVRWADAFAGALAAQLDLSGAVGFDLTPRLEVTLASDGTLAVAVLPLGEGTGADATLSLAPVPGVLVTPAGWTTLGRAWLVPLAVRLLLEAAGDLDRPVFAGGPTLRALITGAGVLNDQGEQVVPIPEPLDMLAGLTGVVGGALELPLGIDDLHLALHSGAGDRLGISLRGDVALAVGGLEPRLLFGDGLSVDVLGRIGSGQWEVHPRLALERVGGGLAGAAAGRLLDTSDVRLDAVEARASTSFDLLPASAGSFQAAAWDTELDLRGLGLPVLEGGGQDNPVAKSLLSDTGAGGGDNEPPNPPFDLVLGYGSEGLRIQIAGTEPGKPHWFPIRRAFGPLYIDQLGVESGEQEMDAKPVDYVGVLIDGSVSLAGLSVSADRLALRIPPRYLSQPNRWSLDLQGLAVAYQQAVVSLQGGLLKRSGMLNGEPYVDYRGALQVSVAGRGFTALGAYAQPTAASGERFTSLFVFVVVAAPLGGPPFLFVTGLGGGAGYNRQLLVPTDPANVGSFPLVQAMRGAFGTDPMAALEQLGEAIPPQKGSLWLAAGVRFSTFELLDTVALAYVSVDRGVEVGLLGLMRAGLPTVDKAIAQLELAIAARYSTVDQVLSIRAQLTENSWLLSRDCQLTGGFAFVVWFEPGETVLTIGGYHPDFAPPSNFPVVPRVGFDWAVGGGIVVKGESYFAITTSAAMVGARLELSYDRSPMRVWFRASLDVLVRFKPFSFTADATVTIGAEFTIRVCLLACATIRVAVELSASLHLEGPPLRGRVRVDLAIASVTVPFGDDRPRPVFQSWPQFAEQFLLTGEAARATLAQIVAGNAAQPERASTTAPKGTSEDPFGVLPEFDLVAETRMPCATWRFGAAGEQAGPTASFLLAPTGPGAALAPTLSVRIEQFSQDAWQPLPALPPDQLVLTPVVGGVSKSVFIPGHETLGPPEMNAPMVPAVTGLSLQARSAVRAGTPLPDIAYAALVDDTDPLPLPLEPAVARRVRALTRARRAAPEAPAAPVVPDAPVLRAVVGRAGRAVASAALGHAPGSAAARAVLEREAAARDGGAPLAPGETQVWELPARPVSVQVSGAAARVVCLNGSGHVLDDRAGLFDTEVPVPEGTTRVVLSGLGTASYGPPATAAGLRGDAAGNGGPTAGVGWQLHTGLVALGPSTLLALGAMALLPGLCPVAGARGEGEHPVLPAREVAAAFPGLATRLPASCTTVLVQLDRRVTRAQLDTVAVTVAGATLAEGEHEDQGDRLTLVYAVTDLEEPDGWFTVSVATSDAWALAGVLGLAGDTTESCSRPGRAPRAALVPDAASTGPPAVVRVTEAVA